jgi:hypothetical protein
MDINTQSQNSGFVYIARIIDHGGKFVNGYHKIGLSKQYKIRETQLNSTHLPFDVLMVRVFETPNMKQLEGLLHLCFEDYRVVKEYDYRKNITTEWFDVSDIDVFNDRVDNFIELMSIYGCKELDIEKSIDGDTTMTVEEKQKTKENIIRQKNRNLRIILEDVDITAKTASVGFINFVKLVMDRVDSSRLLAEFPEVFRTDSSHFPEYARSIKINDLFVRTHSNTSDKKSLIERMSNDYSISCIVEFIE